MCVLCQGHLFPKEQVLIIKITKNGILRIHREKITPLLDTDLIRYLGADCEIEEGVLFGDIWKLIRTNAELIQIIFWVPLGSSPLVDLLKDADKPYNGGDKDPNNRVEYLELYWNNTVETWDGISRFSWQVEFHGRGPSSHDGQIYPDMAWAIEFSSINSLLHYPIKLDTKIELIHENGDKGYDPEGNKPLITFHTDFTVYDIIYGILNELTWAGNPKTRDSRMKEMLEAISSLGKVAAIDIKRRN